MKELSKAEEMVLLAIWRLKDKAYGVSIRRQILKDTTKDYTYGTLYGLLGQLACKKFVEKVKGDPTPEKGGRSKTFFKVTPWGIQALKDTLKLHRHVWKDITEFTFDKT